MIAEMMTLGMMTPPAGQGQQQGGGMMMIGYMAIIFALFYFMMIRPQMKREKERRKLISEIKAGDRVIFCGGLIGTVVNVSERLFTVKLADNVKVDIVRGSVLRVIQKDEDIGELDKQA
jgi:preprotein translocase subunit YajC